MTTSTYTVFCQHVDRQGTTHIDTVDAPDLPSAIQAGRQQCLADWGGGAGDTPDLLSIEDIHCLGVAQGNVPILHWQDHPE